MRLWSLRTIANVAYAFLAESAAADDRASRPVYIAAHIDAETVESLSAMTALDEWLAAPMGRQADNEDALLRYLSPVAAA
jgi:hypothetical protein